MTPNGEPEPGLDALMRELGPVGFVRFLQQFETGHGDYTREREKWLGDEDVDELVSRIHQRRKHSRSQD